MLQNGFKSNQYSVVMLSSTFSKSIEFIVPVAGHKNSINIITLNISKITYMKFISTKFVLTNTISTR